MSRCKGCARPIRWAKSTNGKPIPVDPDERADGNLILSVDLLGEAVAEYVEAGKGTHVSHFATCEYSSGFRKGNR